MTDGSPKKAGLRRLLTVVLGLAVVCALSVIVLAIALPGWLRSRQFSGVWANAAKYEEVVRLVEAGEIRGGSVNGEVVPLPQEYEDLSAAKDGSVIIYREGSVTRVLFYPSSPTPFSVWVYMYTSDDSPMELHGECSGQERERPNWYFFHCP
jgi:hypothetical protein